MSFATSHFNVHRRAQRAVWIAGAALLLFGTRPAATQSLNWEGQTGVFVTPLAYNAGSPKADIGKPIIAYHFLNAGEVLGGFHTTSVTVGLFRRAEFGY